MLHPRFPYGRRKFPSPPLIAADDPIGLVPDLQPIIHDYERNRARNQQRRQKKRPEPPSEPQKTPDPVHHVDEYA